MSTLSTTIRATAAAGAAALLLAACATEDPADADPAASTTHEAHDDHDHDGHGDEATEASEQAAATPRLVMTYDGGIVVLDAATLETVADLPLDGFNRLSPAGDGRHVAVSTTGGWAVLDAGTWSEAHGEHAHHFTSEPALTDVIIEAESPGHVVPHGDLAALWDDGTGEVTVVEISEWEDMVEHAHVHSIRDYTADAPHHGVAVATEGGLLYVTRGDEESRSGAMAIDADGETVVSSDECPGVHGETAFAGASGDEYVVFGCEDGVLVMHGDHAHKLQAEGDYVRTGNVHSVDGSDIVLGDYKTDPEGGLGLSQVLLVDVAAETSTVVDPFVGDDATYTWRGIARGTDGEALVLGTDGALRVLDAATGEVTATIPVIAQWEVPEEWQTAHPALTVVEGMAYVTDPATGTVHAVDYAGGEVWKSADVGVEMNELTAATG
ncbi:hypothetical protein [Demequina activiva]|uniref:PQQ-like domain-containing protein n=1 Tax=Demequina activiva TaxID=1582364 RepID=A0A919UJQ2_9MICO|nr:hypothetical protein [Demequina activiva]GIG54055.1 hypothetical protein Dac01nite_08070 [Demequina activiva]